MGGQLSLTNWVEARVDKVLWNDGNIYKTKEKKQEIYIDKLLYSSGHPQFFWSLLDVYNNSKVIPHIDRTLGCL